MSGIETVYERGQGAYQFDTYYDNLCALQSSVPLTTVKAYLDRNILQINADKIRLSDWPPILKTLRINKSLEKVAIHSYFESLTLSSDSSGGCMQSKRSSHTPSKQKVPAIHSKDLTYQLCKAVKDCLSVSDRLREIELEGLPLRPRDIMLLSKGISLSCSLKSISLDSSHVGDTITIFCEEIKNASTVNSLNLSGCSLAEGAVEAIAKIVKHQAIMRHSEAWKSSLRYRAPDLDCMPGLRRITLNRNPLLGDNGAKALADSLKDDLWLKAVDLQECGLTDVGAEHLLDALRLNSTILVLDIRGNHMVNRSLVERVIQQVMINSDGKTTQFSWLPVETERKKEIYCSRRSSARKPHAAFRTPSKSKTMTLSKSPRKRSASAAGAVSGSPITPRAVPKQRGLPWRTAERAVVHQHLSPGAHDSSAHKKQTELDSVSSSEHSSFIEGGVSPSPQRVVKSDQETLAMLKELQAENISLKRRLKEESAARLAAEDRALELARENRRLQTQLRRSSHTDAAGDEELFTQIEAAFAKFNQFLDVVRDTGLGHLIQEAGLDTFAGTSSPIPAPLQSQSPRQPNISHNYSDYVLKRQIALQSDDIIKPTPDSDSPKKTYSEIMTDGNVLALAAAVRSAEQAEAFVESPTKAKKKRKDKSKADSKSEAAEMITESALSPGTFKIKAFELKDVSELETPKLTPRATAAVDVMKSTEGFPDLPDDLIEEDKSSGRLSSGADKQTSFSSKQAPASGKQAPAELISSRETDTGRLQSTLISEAPGDVDGYSSNDFVSVTGSKDESSAAGEVIHLSEPELSAISYTSSTDRDGKSELVNIKSLSELGSSVEEISASNNN